MGERFPLRRALLLLALALALAMVGLALYLGREDGEGGPGLDASPPAPAPEGPHHARMPAEPRLAGTAQPDSASDAASDATTESANRPAIRGVVLDPKGVPRRGSVVRIGRWERRTNSNGRTDFVAIYIYGESRRTGATGTFVFADLESGRYFVDVLAPPGLLAERVDVELDASDGEISLHLRPALAPRIQVVTEDGQPVEGATVTILRGGHHLTHGTTNDQGVTTLDDVASEWVCRLEVVPPRSRWMDLFETTRDPWHPGDEQVVLETALVISGKIVDEKGEPFARAVVAYQASGETGYWADLEAEDDGTFRIGHLKPGPVALRTGPPATPLAALSEPATVQAGRDDVVLEVARGATLEVVITNWAVPPLGAGIGTLIVTPEGHPRAAREIRIQPDATARVEGLEAGVDHVLWGRLTGAPDHFLLAAGVRASAAPLRLRIERGGVITGRAKTPDEVFPTRVRLSGPGVEIAGIVVDFSDCSFRFSGVPPGVWNVRVIGEKGTLEDGALRREFWWAESFASAGDDLELTLEPRPTRR